MSKKNLLISIILISAIIVAGFLAYKYQQSNKPSALNSIGGAGAELQEQKPDIKPDSGNTNNPQNNNQGQPQPMFYVCQDKCGDGVCQPAGTICNNQLNCPCAETKEDCPQDCK